MKNSDEGAGNDAHVIHVSTSASSELRGSDIRWNLGAGGSDHLHRASYCHRKFDGVGFENATVVLTMNNDPTNVSGGPTLFDNIGTATVSVNNGAPLTFSNNIQVFANQSAQISSTEFVSIVGFEDTTVPSFDILDVVNTAFAAYDLRTSIGPILDEADMASFSPGVAFSTSGGDFILTGVASSVTTFTATTVAVPAPPIGRGLLVVVAFGGLWFGAKLLERSRKRSIV